MRLMPTSARSCERDGAAIIPPIAQADAGPEMLAYLSAKGRRSFTESLALAALFASGDNGQAMIRTIKNDGLKRVAQLNQSEIQFYQFLPLYDVIHLGNVMRRGYSPTSSEMTWAMVDGCFVIADVLSLAAVQPEGAVAAEAIRTEVKAAVREGARSAGRELVETGARDHRQGRRSPRDGKWSRACRRRRAGETVRTVGAMVDRSRRPADCTRSCGKFPRPCPGLASPNCGRVECGRRGHVRPRWSSAREGRR